MSLLDRIAPKVYTQPMVDAIVAIEVEKALLERDLLVRDLEGSPSVDVEGELQRMLLEQMRTLLPEDAPDEILYQVRIGGTGGWEPRKPDAWIMHFVGQRQGCQLILRWDRAEDTTEDRHV
jgi:hypothetical protein